MLNLLEWIHELGGCKKHEALLVADSGVDWQRCLEVKRLAAKSFKTVTLISNEKSVIGWVEGPKSLFLKAAQYVRRETYWQPFLQMETDAVPLKSEWLDQIEAVYREFNGLYMGHVYDCHQPGLPSKVLSGIAVYPFNILQLAEVELAKPNQHWDIAVTKAIIGKDVEQHTNLIYHRWGQKDLPPTFVDRKTNASPINAFTQEDIPKEAVIWHRNKDGTLIELLRKKLRATKGAVCHA